jgi:hypothetical protein
MGKLMLAAKMTSYVLGWYMSSKKDGKIQPQEVMDFIEGVVEKLASMIGMNIDVEITIGADKPDDEEL